MKTVFTIIKWLLPGLLLLMLLLITGSSINHRLQTPREEVAYPPPGQLVPVNGHRLHVYAEGEGELTLIFMSGSGTTAPTLDFRGLYRRLSDDYRTVVVERAGYGWSEDSGTSRDIDTVLGETRRALELAGESPPYVLLPHSMSGLEALHWANRYPDEVAAIIGLDPATPPIYETLPPPRLMLTLVAFTARTGLLRLAPFICHEAAAWNVQVLEALYVVIWYIGPINGLAAFDNMGVSPAAIAAGMPWTYLGLTAILFATELVGRRQQIRPGSGLLHRR